MINNCEKVEKGIIVGCAFTLKIGADDNSAIRSRHTSCTMTGTVRAGYCVHTNQLVEYSTSIANEIVVRSTWTVSVCRLNGVRECKGQHVNLISL